MKLDIFTLFPEAFEWFASQRPVQNALAAGSQLRTISWRETTPISSTAC